MKSICGIDCDNCQFKTNCNGCESVCGNCIAANYIKIHGKEAYCQFKSNLISEINGLLKSLNVPTVDTLYELCGRYVNLEYPIPSGAKVKLLDDMKIYLGTQIELADSATCVGVIADSAFILICSYGENGSNPEILLFQKR